MGTSAAALSHLCPILGELTHTRDTQHTLLALLSFIALALQDWF